ncbi:MAG: glycosyltransferase [Pseudomonadota bacterium]
MAKSQRLKPLAVVVKGYPRLSETFIAQELLALEKRGFQFDIWSLRQPYDAKSHPIHDQIKAGRHYLPEYLHSEPWRVIASLFEALAMPGFWQAFALWRRDFARDRSLNRIRRFGQACVLAAELPEETRLLYAHFLHTPCSVARYAAEIRGLDWGVSAHAKDIWTIPDWEKAEKISACRFGVTCTAVGAKELNRFKPGRVDLAYHGLDLSRFPLPPERRAHNGPFRILSVGRLVEKKGYDDLLHAFSLIPEDLDWRFVHIGGGALDSEMRALAGRLGHAERVLWLGKRDQSEVIEEMRQADLFVLPSKIAEDGDRDGLPNVLMEAASQRLPVLSTAAAAIGEFITDGVHGRLVPPGSPKALAEAIYTLAGAPDTRIEMAEAALKRLRDGFGHEAGIDLIAQRLSFWLTREGAEAAKPVSPGTDLAGPADPER